MIRFGIGQKIIMAAATAVVLVSIFTSGTGFSVPSAVALEQDARCGRVEHIHSDNCYSGNLLVCGEEAHIHSGDCYLLKIEDNDINRLLSAIEADEEKSLEHLMDGIVSDNLYAVEESACAEGNSLDLLAACSEDIITVNSAIAAADTGRALCLNENINSLGESEDDEELSSRDTTVVNTFSTELSLAHEYSDNLLPETGGIGTVRCYVGGGLLVLLALTLLWNKMFKGAR